MTVRALDHVNIRTPDVPATLAFLRNVLGLTTRIAPGAATIDMGGWAYDDGDRPIVHVGAATANYPTDATKPFIAASGGGSVHHVALECTDQPAMIARLDEAGLPWSENDLSSIGLRQVFVTDPNGVLFELNFRSA